MVLRGTAEIGFPRKLDSGAWRVSCRWTYVVTDVVVGIRSPTAEGGAGVSLRGTPLTCSITVSTLLSVRARRVLMYFSEWY